MVTPGTVSTALVVLVFGLLPACSSPTSSAPPAPPPATATALPPGLDTAGMDTSVAPGDDFYAMPTAAG